MANSIKIKVKKLNATAELPKRERNSDAGIDLYSNKRVRITSNSIEKIPTGIAIAIPDGYYGKIEERSGFSLRNTLKLKAGVIDSEYRGEIQIVFQNCGDTPVIVDEKEKIAQLVIHKLPIVEIEEVESLDETSRGSKGFGSSDKK